MFKHTFIVGDFINYSMKWSGEGVIIGKLYVDGTFAGCAVESTGRDMDCHGDYHMPGEVHVFGPKFMEKNSFIKHVGLDVECSFNYMFDIGTKCFTVHRDVTEHRFIHGTVIGTFPNLNGTIVCVVAEDYSATVCDELRNEDFMREDEMTGPVIITVPQTSLRSGILYPGM